MTSGVAIGLISRRTQSRSSRRNGSLGSAPAIKVTYDVDALAFDVVRKSDDGGLGNLRVSDQRTLDFRSPQAVAGDIDHIIHAARNPVITVRVASRAVAREVRAAKRLEIRVDESLVIAEDRAHLSGPAVEQHQVALARTLEDAALVVDDGGSSRRKTACVAEPGFRSMAPGSGVIRIPPVSVCHQVSTMGQRSSPTTR